MNARGALPRVQEEPFRLFFPLAAAIGALGVAPWLLFTTGLIGEYLGRFHAVTQTQAFLVAFASGFLLTAIPKRTRSAQASWAEMGALLLLVPGTSIATLLGAEIAGQAAYAASLVVLAQFAVRRFIGRAAGRRPPASFAMVPVGFVAGVVGAGLTAAGLAGAVPAWALWIGRRLVFEAVFVCLTLGIGAFFLPLAGRGEAASDIGPGRWAAAIAYALAGVAIAASFALEGGGAARAGALLRGVVAAAVIVGSGAWRTPSRPGANRSLLWLAAWAIPVGQLAAAAFPDYRVEALHVLFIGGFGLLSFAVATHVTLGHSGDEARQSGRPWPVLAFGALFAVAMALRIGAIAVPQHYFGWLGAGAALWLLGAFVWSAFLLTRLWRAPLAAEGAAAAAAAAGR
ncbi:MAG: NnrS family protein [Polyangiaceae bacterium]|nr:NnrS family protein [Polyangiaceae bacterium]